MLVVTSDNEIQLVTIEDIKDRDKEPKSTYYIEEFHVNLSAGAVWRKDMPLCMLEVGIDRNFGKVYEFIFNDSKWFRKQHC